MTEEVDVWRHERPREVLLCIAESPKTPKQIIKETGYAQPKVSIVLKQLSAKGLIVPLEKKILTARRPQTAWDINPREIFDSMVTKEFPLWRYKIIKGKRISLDLVDKYYEELPLLVRPFLKKLSKIWRSRRWKQNPNEREEKIGFTLNTLNRNFIKYLVMNESSLTETQRKELDKLLKFHFLSLDPYLITSFKDKDL